jgi:hypothetical protein
MIEQKGKMLHVKTEEGEMTVDMNRIIAMSAHVQTFTDPAHVELMIFTDVPSKHAIYFPFPIDVAGQSEAYLALSIYQDREKEAP